MDYVLLLHRPLWHRGLSQRCCGPETGKADARTDAPPDTGERDGRHVGFESGAVNRARAGFRVRRQGLRRVVQGAASRPRRWRSWSRQAMIPMPSSIGEKYMTSSSPKSPACLSAICQEVPATTISERPRLDQIGRGRSAVERAARIVHAVTTKIAAC